MEAGSESIHSPSLSWLARTRAWVDAHYCSALVDLASAKRETRPEEPGGYIERLSSEALPSRPFLIGAPKQDSIAIRPVFAFLSSYCHRMPVAVQQQQATTMSTVTNQQPLRRAVYVHVSDLTSAYNIDHGRLEQELERVKVEHRAKDSASAPKLPVPTELDTSAPQRRLQPPRTGYNLCL